MSGGYGGYGCGGSGSCGSSYPSRAYPRRRHHKKKKKKKFRFETLEQIESEEFPEPPTTTKKPKTTTASWEDEDLWEKKFVIPKEKEEEEEFPEITSAEVGFLFCPEAFMRFFCSECSLLFCGRLATPFTLAINRLIPVEIP
ncbi:unnamed protein product [Nippostrongylus brasiliensis]|uniref:Uncharacterized protein n=1 Tax=Nippostrongylus brasiliensis TaxID=27835 RepID=A0A0N4XMP3_NIPBR|nr:unnamed protein product [Nippostrongylus brasiliensis]